MTTTGREGGAAKPSQRGPAILVVEDDSTIAAVLADLLDQEGFAVAVARNGWQALDLVDRVAFAVILLDLWMPVMDGREFSHALRHRGLATPIVLMTAQDESAIVAGEIGAIAQVRKPFALETVLTTIDDVFALRTLDRWSELVTPPTGPVLGGSFLPV